MKKSNENETAPAGTVFNAFEECRVSEEQFPHIGKCCRRKVGPGGADYEKICPHCTVWISPPDPATLEIAAIIECPKYGFGKRITG